MAKKIKLTRPELKRQRDAMGRFNRYLPMLKLKQQQLQMTIREVNRKRLAARDAANKAQERFNPYKIILSDPSGVNFAALATPQEIVTTVTNVAGLNLPVFQDVKFAPATYSLFSTPAWVDRVLADMRQISRSQAQLEILRRQHDLLRGELIKIIQRVNLFEKVKIPGSREAIRRIRIHLGDEMTAAVGRAKIAKSKIDDSEKTHNTPPPPEGIVAI